MATLACLTCCKSKHHLQRDCRGFKVDAIFLGGKVAIVWDVFEVMSLSEFVCVDRWQWSTALRPTWRLKWSIQLTLLRCVQQQSHASSTSSCGSIWTASRRKWRVSSRRRSHTTSSLLVGVKATDTKWSHRSHGREDVSSCHSQSKWARSEFIACGSVPGEELISFVKWCPWSGRR